MQSLTKGRYTARLAQDQGDVDRALALRHQCFRAGRGLAAAGSHDRDEFDAACQHVLIEDMTCGALVGCYRVMVLANGRDLGRSYSAQFYDLGRLGGFAAPMLELGRFCIRADCHDPDVLRLAWGALTRLVDEGGIEMLFGCSSFEGAEAAEHREAFALLRAGHLAPDRWRPLEKSRDVYRFAEDLRTVPPDFRHGMQRMPPLLRTYLMMGGWVSDHAVRDRELNTQHVFTGLQIAAIPPGRARLLRQVAL